MLPADVGAAPAAARRYQGTTSTPAPAVRHERRASDADPFGDLVDRYADDRDPAAAGRRAPRPRANQTPTDPRRAQRPVDDTAVADSHASGVRRQPRQHEVTPAVAARPSAADEGRTDLV